jgi:hypothetical protein
VWNKQPEHFRIVADKTYYDRPSSEEYEFIEKLAHENRKLKASKKEHTQRVKKEVPKKTTSLKKDLIEIIIELLL